MIGLIFRAIAGALSLWLAAKFVPGVEFNAGLQYLLLAGAVLGIIESFVKPILNLITLPLRILTLGLFNIVINMAILWIVDVLFSELVINGLVPLFWTTMIFSIINYLVARKID